MTAPRRWMNEPTPHLFVSRNCRFQLYTHLTHLMRISDATPNLIAHFYLHTHSHCGWVWSILGNKEILANYIREGVIKVKTGNRACVRRWQMMYIDLKFGLLRLGRFCVVTFQQHCVCAIKVKIHHQLIKRLYGWEVVFSLGRCHGLIKDF